MTRHAPAPAVIHPAVNTDITLRSCLEGTRLLFVLLWPLLNEQGQLNADKGVALDEHLAVVTGLSLGTVRSGLAELVDRQLIHRRDRYLSVPTFARHQQRGAQLLVARWIPSNVPPAAVPPPAPARRVVEQCEIHFQPQAADPADLDREAVRKLKRAARNRKYRDSLKKPSVTTEAFIAEANDQPSQMNLPGTHQASPETLEGVSEASHPPVSPPRLTETEDASQPRACVGSEASSLSDNSSKTANIQDSTTASEETPETAVAADASVSEASPRSVSPPRLTRDASTLSSSQQNGDAEVTTDKTRFDAELILQTLHRASDGMFRPGATPDRVVALQQLEDNLARANYPTDRWELLGRFMVANGFKGLDHHRFQRRYNGAPVTIPDAFYLLMAKTVIGPDGRAVSIIDSSNMLTGLDSALNWREDGCQTPRPYIRSGRGQSSVGSVQSPPVVTRERAEAEAKVLLAHGAEQIGPDSLLTEGEALMRALGGK